MVYRIPLHRTGKAIQFLPQAVLLHYIAKIQTNMHWDLNCLTLSIEPEHVFQYCTCNIHCSCSEATYTVLLQVKIFLQCICVSYRKVSYHSQNFQYVSYRETCVSLHPHHLPTNSHCHIGYCRMFDFYFNWRCYHADRINTEQARYTTDLCCPKIILRSWDISMFLSHKAHIVNIQCWCILMMAVCPVVTHSHVLQGTHA